MPPDQAAAGAQLAALIAADMPALQRLNFRGLSLGNAGWRPVVDALRVNQHVKSLICYDTGMSEAFAIEFFLPAVRANTSLRKFEAALS